MFGFPVTDPKGYVERVNESRQKHFLEWQEILHAPAEQLAREDRHFMGLYYAGLLVDLCQGRWNQDSHYFDFYSDTARTTRLRQLLNGDYPEYRKPEEWEADLKELAIIAVDFHF